jgi:hypothetical protein
VAEATALGTRTLRGFGEATKPAHSLPPQEWLIHPVEKPCARLVELRHHLVAQQPEAVHHLRMRNQAAAVELGQDAVEAEFLA